MVIWLFRGLEHLPNQYFVLQASLALEGQLKSWGGGVGAAEKQGIHLGWALLCIGCETNEN